MTRFARGGPANKKKPHEGTSWQELKSDQDQTDSVDTRGCQSSDTQPSTSEFSAEGSKQRRKNDRLPEEEIEVLRQQRIERRKDRQRNRRRLKRQIEGDPRRVCFNCRKPGHNLADCPDIQKDNEQGTGICFKCGSTEHSSGKCHVNVPPGKYPYAKCFICGEKGHISKQCPDNPKGLYPKGGGCRHCGSVEHLRAACPELQKEQGMSEMTLETVSSSQSVDAQETKTEVATAVKTTKANKVVNF